MHSYSFLRHLPRIVVGVQQVVRLFAERRSKIVPVELLDVRILVREAQKLTLIEPPEHVAAILGKLGTVVDGLAAAAAQPPGQAMTSTKSYAASPRLTASMSLRAFPSELTTATRTSPAPGMLNVASFHPSMPRTAVKQSGSDSCP